MASRSTAAAPQERLTREERRDQLLDSAAVIVAARGFDGISMEAVAARAGVSKALPYSHFENADALVVALRDRELAILTRRVIEATLPETTLEAKVEAMVRVGFDIIKERPTTVAFLRWLPQFEIRARTAPPPPPAPFEWFVAETFEQVLGLERPVARVLQRIAGMGLAGAVDAWVEGFATQAVAERTLVQV